MNNPEQAADMVAIEAAVMAIASVIGRDPARRAELLAAFDRFAARTQFAAVATLALPKDVLRDSLTAMREALDADPPPA